MSLHLCMCGFSAMRSGHRMAARSGNGLAEWGIMDVMPSLAKCTTYSQRKLARRHVLTWHCKHASKRQ